MFKDAILDVPANNLKPVLFKTDSNDWHIGRYGRGYWFSTSKDEIEEPVLVWCYLEDLENKHETKLICALEQLVTKVEDWHYARNLVLGSDPKTQFAKLISEAGELGDNIAKGRDVEDDIGDMAVVLILLALQHNSTFADCLSIAYEDIKDRKGRMINGTFVKESDLEEVEKEFLSNFKMEFIEDES